MDTLVTENIINSIINDKYFLTDFKAMLNELIEQELSKDTDNMDCDLIDDCTNMLIELEQEDENGFAVIIPPTSAQKIINACRTRNSFRTLSKSMQASLVACIILLSTITGNAAVYKITGHNVAQEIADSINEKLTDWGFLSYAEEENYVTEIPTGSENIDVGFVDDIEPTTAPQTTTAPVTSISKEPTTQPEPTGSENIDVGFVDDIEPTTKPFGKQYKITFDSDGGSEVSSRAVTYRKAIGELPVPVKDGYFFLGWYNIDLSYKYNKALLGAISVKEALPVTSSTIYAIDRDCVLTAKWNKICTVEFYMDKFGGTCDVKYMTAGNDGKISQLPVPVKDGYIFDYWFYYTGANGLTESATVAVDENYVFTEDRVLHPHWTTAKSEFNLYFNTNGGECDIASKKVNFGEQFGELPVATREGYIFMGWYRGTSVSKGRVSESTVLTERKSVNLYALWGEKKYTVHLDTNGNNQTFNDMSAYSNHQFGDLPEPEMDGYVFDGWYLDDTKIKSTTKVPAIDDTDEITLTAKWSPAEVEITFDSNGGDLRLSDTKYYYLRAYNNLPQATMSGYEFTGWFTEADGGEMVTSDDIIDTYEPFTLYAHWEELPDTVSVVVHSNRSIEDIYTINYNAGDTLGDIEIPAYTTDTERDYTKFIGWYDDRYYGNELSADTVIIEDMNIYAHWMLDGMVNKLITLKITNLKSIYELNEPIDINTLSAELSVSGNKKTDLTDILMENGMENHFFGADTSTVGEHTITLKMAYSDFSIIGMGTLCLEATATYTVVDCEHSATHIEKYKQPDCSWKGYSGDTICDDCSYILEYGETLDTVSHDIYNNTVIKNKKTATCTADGYTGDVVCYRCGEIFEKGEVIPALNHPSTHLVRYSEPTCMYEGYTGDEVCDYCNQLIKSGEKIPKLPHGEEIPVPDRAPTCDRVGCTGFTQCADCGAIITEGEYIPALDHCNTVVKFAKEATCGDFGYTGDIFCADCGKLLSNGEFIDKLPHKSIVTGEPREATCTEDGTTGDTYCEDCGQILKRGTVTKALGHTKIYVNEKAGLDRTGYYGYKCTTCGEYLDESGFINAIASIRLEQDVFNYNGSQITPKVIVTDTEGNEITSVRIGMASSRTEVGTYKVTVTLSGTYEGTHYLYFEIKMPSELTVYQSVRAGSYFTIYWTKPTYDFTGYEILLMSDDGEELRSVTINGSKMTSYDFPKKYHKDDVYVIIRTFTKQTVDGVEEKTYSDWSEKFYVKESN